MSALAIVNATQARLQAMIDAISPGVTVRKSPPFRLVDETIIYLVNDGYTDVEKNMGGVVRRTHHLQIHLLVRVTGEPDDAEDIFLPISDGTADTFYTDRKLGGEASDSQMRQRDGRLSNDNAQYLVISEEEMYRSRWWTFDVMEDLSFNFS